MAVSIRPAYGNKSSLLVCLKTAAIAVRPSVISLSRFPSVVHKSRAQSMKEGKCVSLISGLDRNLDAR